MARAVAYCTCKECGTEFKKIKKGFNRRAEANSWEEFVKEVFDLCPNCYAKKVQAEAQENYIIRTMYYGLYKKEYADFSTVYGSYNDEDKTIWVIVGTRIKK